MFNFVRNTFKATHILQSFLMWLFGFYSVSIAHIFFSLVFMSSSLGYLSYCKIFIAGWKDNTMAAYDDANDGYS